MKNLNRTLTVSFVFIWCGLLIGISFIEAWLKFQAPGVTLPIGLEIGKIVFAALNKVECIIAAIILICVIQNKFGLISFQNLFIAIAVALLFLQTVWLLPVLNMRATFRIEGIQTPPSYLHIFYIIAEALKVISLFIFGTLSLNNIEKA